MIIADFVMFLCKSGLMCQVLVLVIVIQLKFVQTAVLVIKKKFI